MKRLLLVSAVTALLFALALACNTAQLSVAVAPDAGPPCPESPPLVTCDASTPTPGACSGGVTVRLDSREAPDASNTIAPGSYPLGCTVQFLVDDPLSATCAQAEPCKCTAPDAGAEADGGLPPGAWQCFQTE